MWSEKDSRFGGLHQDMTCRVKKRKKKNVKSDLVMYRYTYSSILGSVLSKPEISLAVVIHDIATAIAVLW